MGNGDMRFLRLRGSTRNMKKFGIATRHVSRRIIIANGQNGFLTPTKNVNFII